MPRHILAVKLPTGQAFAGDVILVQRLRDTPDRLNPTILAAARGDTFRKIIATEKPNLIAANRRLHQALVEGSDVEFCAEDGIIGGDKVHAIDFANPENNDWLVLNQFTVIENSHNRRPDVAVIEIKNPGTKTATFASLLTMMTLLTPCCASTRGRK
ncbi:MAG: hypothetical protein HC838_01325 [Spirulinaceae cyanobacterium RM2_2_10]|nr:hypothetical protein [Spirulinaceae cyanobacterium RM2_2_10]